MRKIRPGPPRSLQENKSRADRQRAAMTEVSHTLKPGVIVSPVTMDTLKREYNSVTETTATGAPHLAQTLTQTEG